MNRFGHWSDFAKREGLDGLVNLICTGQDTQTVAPDTSVPTELLKLPAGSSVLDFGCGVCRNAIEYARRMPEVNFVAYDSAEMLARAREFCLAKYHHSIDAVKNLQLEDNWAKLAASRFNCVYATLVLQHIQPAEIVSYISDIKKMAETLLVAGRRFNDHDGGSTWCVIESCGLVPHNASEIGYSAFGDPHEHLPLCIYRLK